MVDNHPENKRDRLFYGSQQQSILANTRANDTNEEFKDFGQEVSDKLHYPETKPD